MSLGEIDTLNLSFDKLQALFDESQGYYETFLDANNLYKAGKLSDKEFFQKLGDYTVAYSALEFLSVKVLMEMKKTLDKISAGAPTGAVLGASMYGSANSESSNEDQFCSECGGKNSSSAKFCRECGSNLV